MSNELFASATGSEDKDFFLVQNGDHNNTYMVAGASYWMRVREFMDKCLGEKTNWVKPGNHILIKQNPMTGQVMAEPYNFSEEIQHGGKPEEPVETAQVLEQDGEGNVKIAAEEKTEVEKKDD